MGRSRNFTPLYSIGNVHVISENRSGRYVMVRVITDERLFPNSADTFGKQYVQRARAVMTGILDRALRDDEQVHHKKQNEKHNDALSNLELKDAFTHNSEHHRGLRHTAEVKARISHSLKVAYLEGRR